MRPNFDKYAGPHVKDPAYDPGNKYTMAWQSGLTSIGWDPVQIKQLRPDNPTITSIMDLFDPAFKGKVGMIGDNQDLPNTALLAIGVEPETSTPDDWQKAADLLTKQRDDGIVRQYYEQNYIQALSNGDVALTMAWSGDIFQANLSGDSQGLQFTVPPEGAIIWTDNMCVPTGVEHPVDAITYMDYVYQPEVQAMIEEWVNYISPVPAAQAVVEADAAKATGGDATYLNNVAKSTLVFPTVDQMSKFSTYRLLTEQEEVDWNNLFQPIYQG
jgi:spermidine/putrescine transport system substrate-binding protein